MMFQPPGDFQPQDGHIPLPHVCEEEHAKTHAPMPPAQEWQVGRVFYSIAASTIRTGFLQKRV